MRQPVQPVVEARALRGTRCLHVPLQNRGRRRGGRRRGGERAPGRTPRGGPEAPPGPRALTVLLRSVCRPSLSVSSLTAMALGMSCLLANTSSTASRSSSSCSCGEVGTAEPGTGPGGLRLLCPLPAPPSCPLGSVTSELPAPSPCTLWPRWEPCSVENPRAPAAWRHRCPRSWGSRALRPRCARTGRPAAPWHGPR